jgi:peptidoglycan/LPS O-acetylase OafA/YrhL
MSSRVSHADGAGTCQPRIGYLDGLRAIAILLVLGYHYFARFASEPGLYPYGDRWSDFALFKYGYYGVNLFFAISGFVIALTLERCASPLEFGLRRFARLWPTMLLSSVITYIGLSAFPGLWTQALPNFLPSLTFVDGQIWNTLLPALHTEWIDGAYWSLFVEVRFYFLAAVIYFLAPLPFAVSLGIFASVAVGVYTSLELTGYPHVADLVRFALLTTYLPWFLLGVAALSYLRGARSQALALAGVAMTCLVALCFHGSSARDVLAFVAIAVLIAIPMHSTGVMSALSSKWLVQVGLGSYSLYLLHQRLGLTLIHQLGISLHVSGALSIVLAGIVGVFMIGLSQLIFRYWENPLNRAIVSGFRRQSAMPAPAGG